MKELELNHQIVYYPQGYAEIVALNLLHFGWNQFLKTARVQKIEVIKKLSNEFNPNIPPNLEDVSELAFNQLLDSIKITICFENLFKSLLLLNGYLIHKLDNNQFQTLNLEQYNRPIRITEITNQRAWEKNNKIQSKDDELKYQLKGILKFTLGMKELLAPEYLKTLNFNKEIIDICKPFFNYRNNLHLYCGESLSIASDDFSNLTKIIDFLNGNLVRIHNQLVDKLNKGEAFKLKNIEYNN